MPLTEELVLEYLVQQTEDGTESLPWQEMKCGGFRTQLNDVVVELCEIPSRAGTHWCLTLTRELDKVYVQEPQAVSVFGRRYKSESDRVTAERMRELARMAGDQCEARRQRAWEQREQIRQNVFRRLMFGAGGQTT